MFKFISSFLLISVFIFTGSGAQSIESIRFEPLPATIPGFHSGAVGARGTKLVFIGGRTNGLHGFSSNDGFDRQYANNRVIVIDTVTWSSSIASLSQLPISAADPLRSTNMQHVQDGNNLYMCGGFGWDSIQNKFVTFSTLTVIDLDVLINSVLQATSIGPAFRQINDTIFTVCGGELRKHGSTFMLIGGHDFKGRYTDPPSPLWSQRYHRNIRRFKINDVNNILSVSNYSAVIDSAAFHRRDMIVVPTIDEQDQEKFLLLGGVFKADNTPYQNPVIFDTVSHTLQVSFFQKMNQYTAALINIKDTASGIMYHITPGGMSLYDFDPVTANYVIDSLVPFVKDVSILMYHAADFSEYVSTTQLPDYLGTNSIFIPAPSLSSFSNGVLMMPQTGSEFLLGYMIGGIRGSGPNFMPSTVNDSIYKVYMTYHPLSLKEHRTENRLELFPNPASESVSFELIDPSANVELKIFDSEKRLLNAGELKSSGTRYTFQLSGLKSGIYIIEATYDNTIRRGKLVVTR